MHIEPAVILVPTRIDDDILDSLNSDQSRRDGMEDSSGKRMGFL